MGATSPDRLSDRIKRDSALEREIQRVWDSNFKVYGADKVWRQWIRKGIQVAILEQALWARQKPTR